MKNKEIKIKSPGEYKTMIYIRDEWIDQAEYFNRLEKRIKELEEAVRILEAKK